mgnify:CR=1 FL=1
MTKARQERQERRLARRAQVVAEREARLQAREGAWQRRMAQEIVSYRLRGTGALTFDFSDALALDFDPAAADPIAGLRERLEWLRALRARAEAETPS